MSASDDHASGRIVLVEDEPSIRRALSVSLTGAGYEIIPVATAQEAELAVAGMHVRLVLLDLGLPDRDGQVLLRDLLRVRPDLPVIVISARLEEEQKVAAFESGAVDYLSKPFGNAELLARIRNALRHSRPDVVAADKLQVGDLCIDFAAHSVTLRGEPVKLTPKEFRLLAALAEAPGKMLAHKVLMQKIWGPAHTHDNTYLRIYIGQLRRKIERSPLHDQFIENEPGVGYRLRAI